MIQRITRPIWIIMAVLSAALVIFQFNVISDLTILEQFIKNNIMTVFSTITIISFLMFKVYVEISASNKQAYRSIKIVVLVLLSSVMVLNIISKPAEMSNNLMRMLSLYRVISLAGLMIVMDYFVIKKHDIKKHVIFVAFTFLTISFIYILDIYMVIKLLSFYYGAALLYLMYNNLFDRGNTLYWTKRISVYLITLTLFNDLVILTTGFNGFELTYFGAAMSLCLIYGEKMYLKIKAYSNVEYQLTQAQKENQRLKSDNERTLKSVELLKNDLSYKFMKKQSYFENLEMAIDVLDSSIIVINESFKVELAHGKILESAGIDDLTGLDVSKAIFDISSDEGQYFKSVVGKVFAAEDEVRENLYLSLLDNKIRIGGTLYDMTYNIIHKRNEERILILHAEIISDQSQQSMILAREKEISSMLITIARNSEMFFSDLTSFLTFAKKIADYINDDLEVKENIFRVLRRIHTYKGVFDQYNMTSTIKGLNEIENELFNMLHNAFELSNEQFKKVIIGYDLERILKYDLNTIDERLGHQFLDNKKRIAIDITAFDRVLMHLGDFFEGDHEVLKEMQALKNLDIKEVLESYGQYVERIATDQSKLVKYLVQGDSIKVNREIHVHFFESLIHVLKNCVAHGIEYPDERQARGKNPYGTIKCMVKYQSDGISIVLSDDGKGIDIKEIKNRLFILGKYSIEELEMMSDEIICSMIIEDGITSSVMPNSLAGRGVGMGSIKEIVSEIGGTIEVRSVSGEGVTYEIKLPYDQEVSRSSIPYVDVIHNLALQTERILTKTDKKDTLSSTWLEGNSVVVEKQLLDVTAICTIKGMLDTQICITVDDRFVNNLVNTYGLQLKYKGSNIKTYNEAVTRFIYDIASRVVEELQDSYETIEIKSPSIISNQLFDYEYSGKDCHSTTLNIPEGKLTIMLFDRTKDSR